MASPLFLSFPNNREAREASGQPKQFWWQTEGGSKKHVRGGADEDRDSDVAVASKRRSIAGGSGGVVDQNKQAGEWSCVCV